MDKKKVVIKSRERVCLLQTVVFIALVFIVLEPAPAREAGMIKNSPSALALKFRECKVAEYYRHCVKRIRRNRGPVMGIDLKYLGSSFFCF